MTEGFGTAVLIACKNGEATIGNTVRSAVGQADVYVVSDGSNDRTCEVAEAMGAQVLDCRTSTGKPVALRAGNARFALAARYRRIAVLDDDTTIGLQFTLDGTPLGPLLTTADAPGSYLYTSIFGTATFTAGLHAVSATIVDNRGNITAASPVSIMTGPIQKVPVLNYHGIIGPLDPTPDIYDQTPAQADAELAYLKANGYQSLTAEQYQTWLAAGTLPAGITKPVLITVDDGLTDQLAWDPLLQKYGFKAVLYVVTGFADNITPGAIDPAANMSWQQIQTLAGNGRWQIGFHAGQYGHAEFSDPANTITLGPGLVQTYAAACGSYYSCLGTITTTTGAGARTTAAETAAQFEAQIAAEIQSSLAELKQKVPSASLVSWALSPGTIAVSGQTCTTIRSARSSHGSPVRRFDVPDRLHADEPRHVRACLRHRRPIERSPPALPLRGPHRHDDCAVCRRPQ
jgi:hypothetical protein